MDSFEAIKHMYSWIDQRQWQTKIKNHKVHLINNYTGENFTSEKIIIYSQNLQQIFKARAAYPLPFTPKIILSENQIEKGCLYVLVQRNVLSFTNHLQQILDPVLALQIFRNLLTIVMILCKRYGFFRITKNMIKMTNLGFFQIWINQFQESCHREYPLNSGNILSDCKTMILDLIQIFMETKHGEIFNFLSHKINKEKGFTFQSAKLLVEEAIKNKNFSLLTRRKSEIPTFLRKKSANLNQNQTKTHVRKQSFSSKNSKFRKYKSSANITYMKFVKKDENLSFYESDKNSSHSWKKRNIKSNEKTQSKKKLSYNYLPSKKVNKCSYSTPQSPDIEAPVEIGTKSFLVEGKDVKDSGGSLATTTNFYHSSHSSLKTEELLNYGEKKLLTSFGNKKGQKVQKQMGKMPKYMKIVEQKGEDGRKSCEKSQEQLPMEVQVEKELQFLLGSDPKTKKQREQELKVLENEMNTILFD